MIDRENTRRQDTPLNPQQRAAVMHRGGPCLVLAGAGSGKTRVITHRIAWLIRDQGVAPARICAMTFTNKAAAEMRHRVKSLLGQDPEGLWLLTFHALGLRILRAHAGVPGAPDPGFAVYDRGESLALWRTCLQQAQGAGESLSPANVASRCSLAVNRLQDPAAWDEPGRPHEDRVAARSWVRYRRALREANAVDFDDLLWLPLRLLSADSSLRAQWQSRFLQVLVDEYQDTNRLQYRLLRILVGPDTELTVVGDEDQAIYRWRGADIGNVLEFQRDFSGTTVVRLEQNYRSTQHILDCAGSLIRHNRERIGKNLWSDRPGSTRTLFMLCATERDEAAWVASRVAVLRDAAGTAPTIGILVRTNAQTRPLEEELAARRIPFGVFGGPTFFRRAEVRAMLAWLRLLLHVEPRSFARAASAPPRGIGEATQAKLWAAGRALAVSLLSDPGPDVARLLRNAGIRGAAARALEQVRGLVLATRKQLGRSSLPDLITQLLEETGYAAWLRRRPDGEDRLANLDELVASATEFAGDGPVDAATLEAFLDRTALLSDAEVGRGTRADVSIMTIHAAKGLEFDVVFLAGLEEGLLPHGTSIRDGQVEEERRLCYVAMTRAKETLLLSAARVRRVRGLERVQRPSRFVAEIDPRTLEQHQGPGVSSPALGPGSRGRASGHSARRSFPPVPANARGSGRLAREQDLRPGCAVFHPRFGPGRVTDAQGSGDSLKLTVLFTRAGRKQLIARFAKLQLLA